MPKRLTVMDVVNDWFTLRDKHAAALVELRQVRRISRRNMRRWSETIAEVDRLRQDNLKLALAVSQLTLAKAELEREMTALIGPDSDAPTPRDSATPPGATNQHAQQED